ncbi:MAG: alpha/beta hydrolase fold domain-containing protein [Albidovulum sp.]|nr:alpha/beta hydrolase fold domain-containing protein [Albidovulum sp.]
MRAEPHLILTERNLRETARLYLGGTAADDPMASPIFGKFRGLPPLYVQASGKDLLREDSVRLRDAYAKQNLGLKLEIFPDMLHSFQFFAGNVPEAEAAIMKAAALLELEYTSRRSQ